MKPARASHRPHIAGFSLTEVVCALGLVAGSALPIMGLLSVGLNDARVCANHRSVSSLRESVRQLLKNPNWPQRVSANWEASCWFDATCALTKDSGSAFVEARLASAPGAGFASARVESVRVTFHAVPSGEELGRCVLQRARQGG